jgi:transglutaminase-like putative cysteine protease
MRRRGDSLRVATEVALLGVTSAAVVGMHPLFEDGSFRAPLLVQAVLAHATMVGLRRARVRLLPAALAALVAGVVCVSWVQYLRTTWLLVPSPDTLSAIRLDLGAAWQVFREAQAPAPVEPGFIAASSLIVWVIAFVADWGAFRNGGSFEALLPPATLFLFAAVLGGEGDRPAAAAGMFVAAAMLFLLLHRTWRQEGTATWATLHHHRSRRSLVASGGSLACVAVVAGALVGPNLPGAESSALLPWRDLTEDQQPRVVVSPMVRIQSKLLEQPDLDLFTVRSSDPRGAYWRLTALDVFDGNIWSSSYETDDADGELPVSAGHASSSDVVTQTITVHALADIWLPAAYQPLSLQADGKVDYDEESSTLIVDRDADTSDGMHYTVTSRVPRWTDADLRTATDEVPDDIAGRYLQRPEEFSDRVAAEAEHVTRSGQGHYEQAKLLESYFEGPNFEYSRNVQPGHSDDAMEDFLFVNRKGYCEQFAGTYAAMARSLGIPARVIVGFTTGEKDPDRPGLFQVRGEHAHAWVELWLHDFGWVLFDPTPGRAPPGAEAWLDEPEQQDETGGDGATATTVPGDDSVSGGGPPPTQPSDPSDDRSDIGPDAPERTAPQPNGGTTSFPPPWFGRVLLALAVGSAGYLVLVPLGLALQRRRRRRRARGPAERVDLAWHETNERMRASGLELGPALTIAERAARMRLALPGTVEAIDVLADTIERTTYGEDDPSPDEAASAAEASITIVTAAARRQRWATLLRTHLDIRQLWPEPDRTRPIARLAPRTTTVTTASRVRRWRQSVDGGPAS